MVQSKINEMLKNKTRKEIDEADDEVKKLKRTVSNEINNDDFELIDLYLEYLRSDSILQDASNTFRTVTIVGNLEAEIDRLNNTLSTMQASYKSNLPTGSQFFNKLKQKLSQLASYVWTIFMIFLPT